VERLARENRTTALPAWFISVTRAKVSKEKKKENILHLWLNLHEDYEQKIILQCINNQNAEPGFEQKIIIRHVALAIG